VASIVSIGVSTLRVLRHGAVVLPAGHVDPGAADDAVTISTLSPVSGLLTVTEKVTTALLPGASEPDQVSTPAE
jgi:hypothetical protein